MLMLATVIVILSEVKLLLETCHTTQAIKETRGACAHA